MRSFTKAAIMFAVLLIAGSALSYTLINSNDPASGLPVGTINGYDLENPETRLVLPEILFEISGLTDIDQHTVACVQDEEGLVFLYDLQENRIKRQFKFGEAGDYEGITRVGNTLYILRSDGRLYEVSNYQYNKVQITEYEIDIPVKNNEGLGYDASNNRLLIAGKSKPKDEKYEDTKVVFGFNLNTKTVSEKPVYAFSLDKIRNFIQTSQQQAAMADDPKVELHPSAIAIHPQSGDLFVLSSKDHLIYIFSAGGNLKTVYPLNEKLFNQAEGITFMDNGDMIISNEGKNDEPTLLRFKYKG